MDASTSSGRIGLDVWARCILGAWVGDGMFGGCVSLRCPRSCVTFRVGYSLTGLGGVHAYGVSVAALPWVGCLEVLCGSYHNHFP